LIPREHAVDIAAEFDFQMVAFLMAQKL